MLRKGKLENMKTMKMKILGISEVRYKAQERYQECSKYSTQGVHNRGVAIILDQDIAKTVQGYWTLSDSFTFKDCRKTVGP